MSFVSANDTLNENYTSENMELDEIITENINNNQNIEKLSNNDEHVLLDSEDNGNFSSLAYEIEQSDTSYELTKNFIYNQTTDGDYTNGIVINKAFTLDGKGHTISGNKLARIFYVNASNVILKNIVFTEGYLNGTESYGGAIYWNGDNGNVINCTFTSNKVDNVAAGAIIWNGNSGTITNSSFTGNSAKSDGAVQWRGSSGSLLNCNFTSNKASITSGGAVGWYADDGYIYNCIFKSNNANFMGGAFYSSFNDNLKIEQCVFDTNYEQIAQGGGAINLFNVSGSIINSNFTNNYESIAFNGYGGALFWYGGSQYNGTIINCNFKSNKGTLGTPKGTSIYTNIILSIYNSTFEDANNANTIYNNNMLYLENNTLKNSNHIYIEKGKITSKTSSTLMASPTNCTIGDKITFTGTVSDDNNNSIILQSIIVTVDDNENVEGTFDSTGIFTATFTASKSGNLTAKIDMDDILTSNTGKTVDINISEKDPVFTSLSELINSTAEGDTLYLTQNYTYNSAKDGDYINGIPINKNITIDGQGYTINGNDVARIFYVNAGSVIFKNVILINGKSDYGGAIYSLYEITVENSTFKGNTATDGGAIYSEGGIINNSTFTNNVATNNGGSVFYNARGNIIRSEFAGNTASKSGGAVYFEKRGYIENSTLTNNKATGNNGGALYFKNSGDVIKCIFVNNSAPSNNGGGIFIKDETKTGTVADSIFINNTADKGAGAYIKGIGIVNNSTFINNTVIKSGGAVYIMGNATVTNSNFTNNSASKNGGALYFESKATVDNAIFTENTASTGTSIYSTTTSVKNSVFEDANNSIAIYNTGDLYLENNTFKNNNQVESSSISSITSIIISNVTTYINNEVNITGKVVDSNNNIVQCSSIVLTLNGNNLTTSFNSDGTFYSVFQANSSNIGTYTVSATGYDKTLSNTTLYEGILTVRKYTPSIGIEITNTIYPNDITITVTSNNDGNYSYAVGNSIGNISLVNGTATLTLSKLSIGEYNIIINYEGDENFTNASVYKSFKILAPILSNSNVNMFYLDGSKYSVRALDSEGKFSSGITVTFKINGKTYTRTTDINGYATLSLNINTLVPKTYTVTATYNGYTVKNTVKVKQIIKAKKTTKVKKTAKKLKIKITLKGKTVLKKKTLKVKFKGKTYKIKTNKKGIAYFKLTKKVIKKLKKGKTYKYTIIYSKDTLKRYIKVKK